MSRSLDDLAQEAVETARARCLRKGADEEDDDASIEDDIGGSEEDAAVLYRGEASDGFSIDDVTTRRYMRMCTVYRPGSTKTGR